MFYADGEIPLSLLGTLNKIDNYADNAELGDQSASAAAATQSIYCRTWLSPTCCPSDTAGHSLTLCSHHS